MSYSKILGALSLALPLLGVGFIGLSAAILGRLMSSSTHEDTVDAPGWLRELDHGAIYVWLATIVLVPLAGFGLGAIGAALGKQPGGSRAPGIAGAVLNALLLVPACLVTAYMLLLADVYG